VKTLERVEEKVKMIGSNECKPLLRDLRQRCDFIGVKQERKATFGLSLENREMRLKMRLDQHSMPFLTMQPGCFSFFAQGRRQPPPGVRSSSHYSTGIGVSPIIMGSSPRLRSDKTEHI